MMGYDSTADTLKHSQRVGEYMVDIITILMERSVRHDRSKTEPPELDVFNEFTPKLKHSTYGSDEYKGFLEAMGEGLAHHYAHNRHHPEHYPEGIAGMTLMDLIEMLADWKAATERHADGDLARSLVIQAGRFEIDPQLASILENTAYFLGWLVDPEEGVGYTLDGQSRPGVADLATVRRLTPLECERLQGFPDGWTDIPGNSDTQRYRQLGNAVAVPVAEWIMRRLVNA